MGKTPLRLILELYKEAQKQEPIVIKRKVKNNYKPVMGDIIEIFPSIDGIELLFLIFRKYKNGMIELLPVSRFWEFATQDDVLISIGDDYYIVQTDLSFEVPEETFSEAFGNRYIFKVHTLNNDLLKEINLVKDGKKKGAGNMKGGVKGEFKNLEAQRYFKVFVMTLGEID